MKKTTKHKTVKAWAAFKKDGSSRPLWPGFNRRAIEGQLSRRLFTRHLYIIRPVTITYPLPSKK